jgi:hypothetical protein
LSPAATPALPGLLLALALIQSETPPPAVGPGSVVKGADLELLATVRRLAERVERLRGEEFVRAPLAIRAPAPIREVAAEIRAHTVVTRERLEARGRAWADVGLGDSHSPARLFEMLSRDLGEIGYEAGANRLLVDPSCLAASGEPIEAVEGDGVDDATVLMMTGVEPDEPVAAHMLMHVRQYERRGADMLAPTTDQTLARSAWAEGEANLVAVRMLFAGMGLADDVVTSGLDPTDLLSGRLFPADLDGLQGMEGELARFVYLEGYDEAARRFRAGGWEQVDAGIRRADRTRDLLHPGAAAAPAATVSTPAAPGGGALALLDEDSLGEQAILVLLAHWTGKDNLALQAADGWAGDRLYRWEPAGEGAPAGGVTQWHTRWSGEQHAADFDYALSRALGRRFPERRLAPAAPGVQVLRAGERVFRLERDGAEVQLWVLTPEWDARLIESEAVAPQGGR